MVVSSSSATFLENDYANFRSRQSLCPPLVGSVGLRDGLRKVSGPRSEQNRTTASECPQATTVQHFLIRPSTPFSLFHRLSLLPNHRPFLYLQCKTIEDVPARTATHPTTLSPTAFPSSRLWRVMISTCRNGMTLLIHSFSTTDMFLTFLLYILHTVPLVLVPADSGAQ
jgi:hypothetical protein